MGAPLEKVYHFGFSFSVKQVLDVELIGDIDPRCLYLVPWPTSTCAYEAELTKVADQLPLALRVRTSSWYFVCPEGRSWEEYLKSLKPSHGKKIRRYLQSPAKRGYSVQLESPEHLELPRCYELLCQTMRHNQDHHFYTQESFQQHLSSLEEVWVARLNGQVVGFYSGAVIGHDHSLEFRSFGVYHNLFLEHVKLGFQRGEEMIDLGNAGDSFKRELGAKAFEVAFSLRSTYRRCLALMAWGLQTWVQVLLQPWPWWLQLLVGVLVLRLCLYLHKWLSILL
ncbi:unnamed protein product [Effrenium voratum]|uniref:BioF2-like acetyltransferase domain-containing protein n=1 Tax=Effrenium voratum TaxID=2562239 RepID=A0AA36HPD9_9DINO|nr:unnamed protein product [Effrenium voratum]